jgi:hypothetical protein
MLHVRPQGSKARGGGRSMRGKDATTHEASL